MREMVMCSRVAKSAALAIGGFLLAATFAFGQGSAVGQAPTLSDVDRLKLQNLALAMEVAKLRAEAAQRDYDQSRDQLRALLRTLEQPGYLLDLSTLTYQPAPVAEAPR